MMMQEKDYNKRLEREYTWYSPTPNAVVDVL